MTFEEVSPLAKNWFSPLLDEQRHAFPRAVQGVLGEAAGRGMAQAPLTYGSVENLAHKEVEQRGRTMLEGYTRALGASAGPVPQSVLAKIKQALDAALLAEAEAVHGAIDYVREAIKPARTKTADELRIRPMQKLIAELDLFCAQLNTERGIPTFGWKPTSVKMWTFANYEQGQLSTPEAVHQLIERMFLEPETQIHYYYQDQTAMDAPLAQAIHAGAILLTKSEFRFFKHPEIPHDYIQIAKDEYEHEWQEQAAEFTPEFVQATLELSVRKRAELDTIKKVHLEDEIREQLIRQKWSYDVFLSYSERDEKSATLIRENVTAAGGRLFMAPKEISPGDDFAVTIRNALRHSRELWLLLSPHSIKSEWVTTEWGAAWVLEKRIVPILYRSDVTALPDRLRGIQSIDLHAIDDLVAKTFPRV